MTKMSIKCKIRRPKFNHIEDKIFYYFQKTELFDPAKTYYLYIDEPLFHPLENDVIQIHGNTATIYDYLKEPVAWLNRVPNTNLFARKSPGADDIIDIVFLDTAAIYHMEMTTCKYDFGICSILYKPKN